LDDRAAEFVVTDTTTLVRSLEWPEVPPVCDCP